VETSVAPHAEVDPDEDTEYGYLWWLRDYPVDERSIHVWMMSGNGGNKVVVAPELDLVAVITAMNFRAPNKHEITDRVLRDYVLAAYS
jgi:CubicO group peptidase (beta-lactamase class C family)